MHLGKIMVLGLREFSSPEKPNTPYANLTSEHEHFWCIWMTCKDELQYDHLVEM